MSISVRNNQTKTIPFGKGIYFNPGVTIISDPKKLDHLRVMEKAFKGYLKAIIPGKGLPVFVVEAGSLDKPEPKKKDIKKKNNKKDGNELTEQVSPFSDKTEDEALIIVQGVLDVESLEFIIATEKRESVIEKAKEILADIKKLPVNNKE